MMRSEFKLAIDVTVTTGRERDGAALAPLINEALAEVTNRIDFRRGTFKLGRVLDQSFDHGDQRITVDVTCMRTDGGPEG